MIPALQTTSLALLGGILPPLVWLWFWLKEDSKRPEPKRLISLAFLAGILAIAPVLFLETGAYNLIQNESLRYIVWAAIEEIIKFILIYALVLRNKEVDEPIDYIIYLITGALGFAALENTLFLWPSLNNSEVLLSVVTGNLRFIGSTLLHVTASGIIGIAMGFGFYKTKKNKLLYLSLGILMAVALHAAFNLSIISDIDNSSLIATSAVWIVVVITLLFFEKIKRVRP